MLARSAKSGSCSTAGMASLREWIDGDGRVDQIREIDVQRPGKGMHGVEFRISDAICAIGAFHTAARVLNVLERLSLHLGAIREFGLAEPALLSHHLDLLAEGRDDLREVLAVGHRSTLAVCNTP